MCGTLLFRAFWSVAVLGCAIGFAVQVGTRGGDYFKYETNVDVQVVYSQASLILPAVTICNQNNHRYATVHTLAKNISQQDFLLTPLI